VRGACTRQTSTLISIIQNMLTYYIKYRPNIDPLKVKIMKLIYTKKSYINGITIHFAFYIFLNKSFNELKALNDEKYDTLY
jgi:hypothetical protein